jgi:nicotinate-nucleotide adenylyltransferase
MRRLWYGGSFNPIHNGHLICARAVAETAGFDQIMLVPSAQPPHKQKDKNIAPANLRLAMCRLAVAGDEKFAIDDFELTRSGPSYTIDSVRHLRTAGHSEISWLIGADMATSLPTWHKAAELLAEVNFVLMARPGHPIEWSSLPPAVQKLQSNVVTGPLLDISSSDLRDRLKKGLSIRYLTPGPVIDYIQAHQLYRDS